eukprot:747486-Hanusia_phi.AAC.1
MSSRGGCDMLSPAQGRSRCQGLRVRCYLVLFAVLLCKECDSCTERFHAESALPQTLQPGDLLRCAYPSTYKHGGRQASNGELTSSPLDDGQPRKLRISSDVRSSVLPNFGKGNDSFLHEHDKENEQAVCRARGLQLRGGSSELPESEYFLCLQHDDIFISGQIIQCHYQSDWDNNGVLWFLGRM